MRIRKRQCVACPWKTSTVPERDIANGYSADAHRALKTTIAAPGSLEAGPLMACHESPVGREQVCAGWIAHQLGPGNNLVLRMRAMDGRFDDIELDGPQHECFEDTLPKGDGNG